jgi:hypothetical protein
MKRYLYIMASFVFFFTACEKDTEGVSKETEFAVLTMEGDQYSSIVKGGTFTDPGVTAKEGETELTVAVKGQVNPNVVGIYELVYSAANKEGYPGSVTRTVAVIPAAENPGVDLSGSYTRATATAQITKYAPGFYLMSNVYGPSVIPTYILTGGDGKNLILPENALSGFGPVVGTGVVAANGNIDFIISLLAQNASFQNFGRSWVKN